MSVGCHLMFRQCKQTLNELLHLFFANLSSIRDSLGLGQTHRKTTVKLLSHTMHLLASCIYHLEHQVMDIDRTLE